MTDDRAREIAESFAGRPEHLPLIRALRLLPEPTGLLVEEGPAVRLISDEPALYSVGVESSDGAVEATTSRYPIRPTTLIHVDGPRDRNTEQRPGLERVWRFEFEFGDGESEHFELTGWEGLDMTTPFCHDQTERFARFLARAVGWDVEVLGP